MCLFPRTVPGRSRVRSSGRFRPQSGAWPNSGSNCGAVRRKMGRNLDWRLTSGSLDVGEGVSLLSGHAAPGSACAHGAGRNHRNLKRRHRASFGRCARWGVFPSAVPGRPQVCGAAGCRGMAMSDPVVGCNDRPLVGKRAGAAFSDSSVGHQPCGFARCAGRRQRSHRVAWGACTATRKTHWQPRRRAGFRDSCKTRRPCRLLRIRVATLGGSRVAAGSGERLMDGPNLRAMAEKTGRLAAPGPAGGSSVGKIPRNAVRTPAPRARIVRSTGDDGPDRGTSTMCAGPSSAGARPGRGRRPCKRVRRRRSWRATVGGGPPLAPGHRSRRAAVTPLPDAAGDTAGLRASVRFLCHAHGRRRPRPATTERRGTQTLPGAAGATSNVLGGWGCRKFLSRWCFRLCSAMCA